MLKDDHEYEVLELVLRTEFPSRGPRQLLRAETGGTARFHYADYAKFAGLPFAQGPAKRTYSAEKGDWILKNCRHPCRLDPAHPQLAAYELLSPEDMEELFGGGRDLSAAWQAFHHRYPGRGGLLGVSRVGLDLAQGRAMVQVAISLDHRAAFGKDVHLVRDGETWTVTRAVMAWVS
ncbi:hypothetical protein [Deinococcus multiflagellatus]|uniref:Transcriptional regulator n=1 Tax=Deinococcus multiflagellatus TaxID=1656887 RepID=A0ABW1ZTN3_9DEIO|nr:hypothetical protein [Deinococcus multiflagellatus]MBZ9715560.1 hypothetical protein [Deinococcus multiflagellatus]